MADNETIADIIAEARDKYTVHDCSECEYRKSCDLNQYGFDMDECREKRQSIALIFGIQDEYFTKLLCRLEAAHKREAGDAAKLREALIDVVKRLEVCVGCDHYAFHPTATTCDGITSVGKCGKIATCAAIFKARSALAATEKEGGNNGR